MSHKDNYSINLDNKYGFLRLIDANALAAGVTAPWFNQTLTQVNDSVVRIGVFQPGEFHWHKHENEDEFFFVLKGSFIIELEDSTVTLTQHQGFTVPKGVMHRPRTPEPTVILMVEGATVSPVGD
jgi:mannose-6-phosphate isomerase-like protein (cupin superfamily)